MENKFISMNIFKIVGNDNYYISFSSSPNFQNILTGNYRTYAGGVVIIFKH